MNRNNRIVKESSGGIASSLRDTVSGLRGVDVCIKVPTSLSLTAVGDEQQNKRTKRSAALAEIPVKRDKNDKTNLNSEKPSLKIQADSSVSEFIDGAATLHSTVNVLSFSGKWLRILQPRDGVSTFRKLNLRL